MRIIPRYMLRNFLPVFTISMFGFVGLYLIVDFFERIDRMMEHHLAFHDIYSYFLFKIPQIMTQGIPMSAILSAIITLGVLKRNRELIAMETAGLNPAVYIAPLAVTALLLSVLHFGVGEYMARPLNQKLQDIWDVKVRNLNPSVWWNPENVWYREENTIYQIRLYDRANSTMEKVSIFFLDPQFRLNQRLDARRISWTPSGWIAEDGLLVRFESGHTQQQWFDRQPVELNVTPQSFARGQAMPEDLGMVDLYSYIRKIEQEGYSSTPYRVELHMRMATPFATLILALLGMVVALRQGLHGGIAAGVGFSLILAFSFLVIANVGSSLASAGTLPPFLGVWAGNIIFTGLVCYNWIREYT